MADNDMALIVAIDDYSDGAFCPPLRGPNNDAMAFRRWLTSDNGGDVPGDRITQVSARRLLGKQPLPALIGSRPTLEDVREAICQLRMSARAMRERDEPVGRLYLYFAGHGFASDFGNGLGQMFPAMYTAEVTRDLLHAHLLCWTYGKALFEESLFREVFLFMDFCQTAPGQRVTASPLPFDVRRDELHSLNSFFFWMAGATAYNPSFEHRVDGKTRGIFTEALVAALKGCARDPDTGALTAQDLKKYLYNTMPHFLTDDERAQIGHAVVEPDIDYLPNSKEPRSVALVPDAPAPTFRVHLHIPRQAIGQRAEITFGDDCRQVVVAVEHVRRIWKVRLPWRLLEVRLPDSGLFTLVEPIPIPERVTKVSVDAWQS
ncbi:MAG: caspase family protein [Chloroflexota bacterium]|nr:caspase family protein [Chloroflexota bacterium]